MIEGQWQLLGDGIIGWARDKDAGRPLWVELLADGVCLGITLADMQRPEPGSFYIQVAPVILEEGASLALRVANTDILLPERRVESGGAEPDPAGLTGELYVDRGLRIGGWAVDAGSRDEKLRIYAVIDGKKIADTAAAERCYRPAIADGHGFGLELPPEYANGKSHVVHVQDEHGRPVPGSPVRVRSLQKKTSEWLKEQKSINRPAQELLVDLLETVEERLPGVIAQGKYEYWKKVFPIPTPAAKVKIGLRNINSPLLKGQGGDLKRGEEFIFLPGGALTLHKNALAHMAATMRETGAALVYADGETDPGEPLFKPAWDRESFLARDYLGPCLIRADVADQAGIKADGLDVGDEGIRFNLVMAAAESGKIAHLPLPLSVEGVASPGPARKAAANEWLKRKYPGSSWRPGGPAYAQAKKPPISIIIPTRDHGDLLETCLNSLWTTDWPDYEIIIIDNGTVEDKALALMQKASERDNVCVLRRPGVFNYADLNNSAVRTARGEYVCFLNNDTEVLEARWLGEMAALLAMAGAEAGAVGAKLLWPNNLVQHGGVVVGTHQLAAHVGNQWLDDDPGYMHINQMARRCSVVTAACMLTPRELFLGCDGFDWRNFPIAFNDVDYCLRLGEIGKKIYWTPQARLAHHESASRGKDLAPSAKARSEREMTAFRSLWGHYDDIFYNPNLPLSAASEPYGGLAFPPRRRDARVL